MTCFFKFLIIVSIVFLPSSLLCQTLLRGPYLQIGTSSSIIVKWQTSIATDSQVKIGTTSGTYFKTVENSILSTEHEVIITQLLPNTKYYYTIGSSLQILQGDQSNYFTTYPSPGTDRKFRFWITGDCGNNSTNQRQVRDQYLSYAGSESTDGWLLLGDNAYNSGLITEYDPNFFAQYQGSIMKHTVLWPTPGNHDYANNSALQVSKLVPYYDLFTVPTQAEAGGVASQTESYYSYNIGNTHFISLDSYGIENVNERLYDTLSPQVVWLKKDLVANQQTWTVVYWHHPPYTKGSHDSDAEGELVSMRENFLRILERNSVDLVLCGHSHSYERSKLMKGHYGFSSSFDATAFNKSTSSSLYNGSINSCPYVKHTDKKGEGIVYVVAGSAGQVGGGTTGFPHPAMHYSNRANGGSVILEVEKNRLDLKWLSADGVIRDSFTMMKDVTKNKSLSILYGDKVELAASWVGDYKWNNKNEISKTISVSPKTDTVFVVQDSFKCLADSFKIAVDRVTGFPNEINEDDIKVFPNPSSGTIWVELPHSAFSKIVLSDLFGKVISTQAISVQGNKRSVAFELEGFQLQGLYFITACDGKKRWVKKVIIK